MKIKKYINRNLIKATDTPSERKYFLTEKFTDLNKLIDDKDSCGKRIVILGEAGSGKSTELFFRASDQYREKDYNNVPVFIPLNTYTGDNSFKDYISIKLGESADTILHYDKSKLVFFLDEFDQVINKGKATRDIINFVYLYSESMFIISCRSNVYSDQFPEFERYVLAPFDEKNIRQFAEVELPTSYNQFISRLKALNLEEISKIPFFLKQLIDIFRNDGDLPKKQSMVLDKVISISIINDIKKSAFDLSNKYPQDEIRKDLTYLSIIFEILQRNHLYSSEINLILNSEFKRDVIKSLNLIDKTIFNNEEVFRFQHNNFNEYLAANLLSHQEYTKILEFVSIKEPLLDLNTKSRIFRVLKYLNLDLYGLKVADMLFALLNIRRRLKINPSWVNTIGFTCQLRDDKGNNDIINYLIKHEPELALNIEINRLYEGDRFKIFKSIFDAYLEKRIPIREEINLSRLKDIIAQSESKKKNIFDYLMKYAYSEKHHSHRFNALQLLCFVKGINDSDIIETYIRKINDLDEEAYIKHICIFSLVELDATEKSVIDRIAGIAETDDDYTLSGLYYILFNSNDIDSYVNILLDGIPKSRIDLDSSKGRLGDEKYFLSKCLEKITSPSALKSIIDFLSDNPKLFHDYDIKRIIPSFMSNLTKAYKQEIEIFDYAKKLFISAEKSHRDEVYEIGTFFANTNTSLNIFKDLYSQGIENHYDTMAVIINNECLSFLLKEYYQGNVTDDNMWILIRHIAFRNRDIYQESIDFINQQTGNKFIPEPPIDYKSRDRKELLRKIEIIFNKDDFIYEVENIYSASKASTLNHANILDLHYENIRETEYKYNDFVLHEVENIFNRNADKAWSEEDLVKELNSYDYEYFTIEHVFRLLYDGVEIELTNDQISIVEDYCKLNLNRVDFRNALSVERKSEEGNLTTTANGLALRLWLFKRKYGFIYPENILLDMLSFDWIAQSGYCGIKYLEQEIDRGKIGTRIKHNINKGIAIAPVLINHVDYCVRNNIHDVVDNIVALIDNKLIDDHERKQIIELLYKLPNSRGHILNYLKSDNKDLFLKASELLMTNGSKDTKDIIQKRIKDKNFDIAVESSKLLIPYQDIDAIKFYINCIINKKHQEAMHSPLGKIECISALKELERLLFFYFENRKELEDDHSFLFGEIMHALKNIARKDRQDMRKVLRMMKRFIKKHEKKYSNVVYLNRYCDDIENEYYTNYKEVSSINEAIEKAKTL